MTDKFKPGCNWSSKDGKRKIVIDRRLDWGRGECFAIRNLATGRVSHIEMSGLIRKFRFTGYDPAYEGSPATTACLCVGGAGPKFCPKHGGGK